MSTWKSLPCASQWCSRYQHTRNSSLKMITWPINCDQSSLPHRGLYCPAQNLLRSFEFFGAWSSVLHNDFSKPVDKLLSLFVEHNSSVVIISESPAQLFVSHVAFVLPLTPEFCSQLWVDEFKSSFFSWDPTNTVFFTFVKKLFKEFPQDDCFSH